GPSTPIAAAVSLVVVVLPFVPETSAISRPAARLASRLGSIIRPILPPMTAPSPRPVARDSAAAPRDRGVATLARSGTLLWVISLSRVLGERTGVFDRRGEQVPAMRRPYRSRAQGPPGHPVGRRPPLPSTRARHGPRRGSKWAIRAGALGENVCEKRPSRARV